MNKKGFTLIELMIVIAILGILAIIVVPLISKKLGNEEAVKEKPKIDFQSKIEKKTVSVPTQQIVECVEGKQMIKIQGEKFYLGRIKNSWGDLEPVKCE